MLFLVFFAYPIFAIYLTFWPTPQVIVETVIGITQGALWITFIWIMLLLKKLHHFEYMRTRISNYTFFILINVFYVIRLGI